MRAGGEAVGENKPLGSYKMDLSPCDNSDHVSKDLSVTTNSAYPALFGLNSVFVQTSYHMEGAFSPVPSAHMCR